jgi:hypothetical protein
MKTFKFKKWAVVWKDRKTIEDMGGNYDTEPIVGVETQETKDKQFVFASIALFDSKKEALKVRAGTRDWMVKPVNLLRNKE